MPATAKPLFRPEALRPQLAAFALPPSVVHARPKIERWAQLLGTKDADQLKETELLREFITAVW